MSLETMKKRVSYRGGSRQVDRMIKDKARSLNGALDFSYQSATAVLQDGREFRCLINPNKISMEIDDKMLSIPFEDYCLNGENDAIETIGVKCGDTIQWKENGTHWIVYSQYLQEIAYFRGLMRQCEDEPIQIGDQQFWFYMKGPDDKTIEWQKTKNLIFNDLSYTVEIYISNTPITNEFFHRFQKCSIKGRNFEVQAVDDLTVKGLLTVYLKETYSNVWDAPIDDPELPEVTASNILGPVEVSPFDIVEYKHLTATAGAWSINNNKARIIGQTESGVKVEITSGKQGQFVLSHTFGTAIEELLVTILPL